MAAKGKIKKVEFNAPDGDREGVITQFWPGDNIVVKSWPKGSGRKGDEQLYEMMCTDYAMGGDYPEGVFWASCSMLPVVHRHDTYSMASGGTTTEGTILFHLQPSPKEANTNVTILGIIIGAFFFLI